MAKKRANGDGSIFFRKDKNLWCAVISIKDNAGTLKKVYQYGRKRKDVAVWLAEQTVKRNRGFCVKESDISLYRWLRKWFEVYAVPNIRTATRTNYEAYIERHIKNSAIAGISLSKLKTDDIQRWINRLKENGRLDGKGGLSAKTIRNIFNMLYTALKQALGNNLIYRNPAEYVILPKTEKIESRFLTVEEQKRLCNASANEKWHIGIILTLFTGLRIGELLALRRSDIIVGESGITYISVSKSLNRVSDYGNEGSCRTILKISEPKTSNSKRKIPLIPTLIPIITSEFQKMDYELCNSDEAVNADPFIICNKYGDFVDPSTYRKWFKKMTAKADISDATPHTLRHTYAANSLKYGIDLKNISMILGHYSTEFSAKTYIHTNLENESIAVLNLLPLLNILTENNKESV